MSLNTSDTPFIFYLILEEELPENFFLFDRLLKESGFMLIPVRVDQLQTLVAAAEQSQVIVLCSVMNSREVKSYQQRVRKFLKYLLKSKGLTFMLLTSFYRLNDARLFRMQANYFLIKYPLDARELAHKIVRYHGLKVKVDNTRWPGGRRAGVRAITV
jgi:hypothetical protein